MGIVRASSRGAHSFLSLLPLAPTCRTHPPASALAAMRRWPKRSLPGSPPNSICRWRARPRPLVAAVVVSVAQEARRGRPSMVAVGTREVGEAAPGLWAADMLVLGTTVDSGTEQRRGRGTKFHRRAHPPELRTGGNCILLRTALLTLAAGPYYSASSSHAPCQASSGAAVSVERREARGAGWEERSSGRRCHRRYGRARGPARRAQCFPTYAVGTATSSSASARARRSTQLSRCFYTAA